MTQILGFVDDQQNLAAAVALAPSKIWISVVASTSGFFMSKGAKPNCNAGRFASKAVGA